MKIKMLTVLSILICVSILEACSPKAEPTESNLKEYFQAAEKIYGVDRYTLEAIYQIESSQDVSSNSSNQQLLGPLNFQPAAWAGWVYNTENGQVPSDLDITNLDVIASGEGYGVDGNNDGLADPANTEDSIHSLANFLARNGYDKDVKFAILQFNHSDKYANNVLSTTETIKNEYGESL